MKSTIITLIVILLISAVISTADQNTIEATTADGRKVILYPEGTWEFITSDNSQQHSIGASEKPDAATSSIRSKKGIVEIWYDPAKWMLIETSSSDDAEFMFEHVTEDCYALVIVERIGMNLDALRDLALENLRSAGASARVVEEEIRSINNTKMLVMGLEGLIEGITFRYQGCYWASQSGAVQVVAFTGKNLYPEYEKDITDLLNGTMILAD